MKKFFYLVLVSSVLFSLPYSCSKGGDPVKKDSGKGTMKVGESQSTIYGSCYVGSESTYLVFSPTQVTNMVNPPSLYVSVDITPSLMGGSHSILGTSGLTVKISYNGKDYESDLNGFSSGNISVVKSNDSYTVTMSVVLATASSSSSSVLGDIPGVKTKSDSGTAISLSYSGQPVAFSSDPREDGGDQRDGSGTVNYGGTSTKMYGEEYIGNSYRWILFNASKLTAVDTTAMPSFYVSIELPSGFAYGGTSASILNTSGIVVKVSDNGVIYTNMEGGGITSGTVSAILNSGNAIEISLSLILSNAKTLTLDFGGIPTFLSSDPREPNGFERGTYIVGTDKKTIDHSWLYKNSSYNWVTIIPAGMTKDSTEYVGIEYPSSLVGKKVDVKDPRLEVEYHAGGKNYNSLEGTIVSGTVELTSSYGIYKAIFDIVLDNGTEIKGDHYDTPVESTDDSRENDKDCPNRYFTCSTWLTQKKALTSCGAFHGSDYEMVMITSCEGAPSRVRYPSPSITVDVPPSKLGTWLDINNSELNFQYHIIGDDNVTVTRGNKNGDFTSGKVLVNRILCSDGDYYYTLIYNVTGSSGVMKGRYHGKPYFTYMLDTRSYESDVYYIGGVRKSVAWRGYAEFWHGIFGEDGAYCKDYWNVFTPSIPNNYAVQPEEYISVDINAQNPGEPEESFIGNSAVEFEYYAGGQTFNSTDGGFTSGIIQWDSGENGYLAFHAVLKDGRVLYGKIERKADYRWGANDDPRN